MPDIRLVALDLDGTVFNDEKEITPRTLEAIRAAIAKGVDVIPATGRVASGVPEAFLRIPGVRYALTATFMISWPQRAVPWAFLSAAKPTLIILVPMTALP